MNHHQSSSIVLVRNYFTTSSTTARQFHSLLRSVYNTQRFYSKMATIVRKIIHTAKCPKALAPYNQAVVADRTVYCSGVLGMELDTLKLVEGGAASQTAKALEHLTTLLQESGSCIEKVVKTTILLADMNDYATVNDEYKRGRMA